MYHHSFKSLATHTHKHTHAHAHTKTRTHTHTHTHIHVWGGFRGIGYLAAKLGTWIIPHFHGVYSYDVPRNIAISRPKMCKKKLHNRYDFLPVTGGKIELSNNARGHPIACILPLPLDCLTSDFWIWGYPHCFWIPHLPEMKSVCVPENPPIHTGVNPGGDGGGNVSPPPLLWVGGWPVQTSPPLFEDKIWHLL